MAVFWTTSQPQIANYIRQRINDAYVVEDLTSATIEKAWTATISGNGAHEHLRGWLFRIAHNLIIDYYRERDRWRIVSIDDAVDIAHDSTPLDTMVEKTEQEWLARAIKQLRPQHAQVIRLRNEGYAFEEVAEMLNTTTSAVKALRHRALVNLQRLTQHKRTNIDATRTG